MLNPTASFLGELHISPVEDSLQAAHDVLELTAVTRELRSSTGTLLFSHVPVVIVMRPEPLLASQAFAMVG